MGLRADHLRDHVIRPTLAYLALGRGDSGLGGPTPEREHEARYPWIASTAAAELVLGTALVESDLRALVQYRGGSARSLWQIEPPTAQDVLRRLGQRYPVLYRRVMDLALPAEGPVWAARLSDQLPGNLYLGAALCRMVYALRPEPLPPAGRRSGQAYYWKAHYNTVLGAGTVADYVAAWDRSQQAA